jgi:hypothetical protein
MTKTFFKTMMMIFFSFRLAFAQKPVEVILPQTSFDEKTANSMLNGGTAQIKGTAYYEGRTLIGIKSEATVYAPVGTIVSLYPITAYLEEYLKLKKKNKEGKRIAAISPLAACYRIESKVFSQQGEFIIPGLKPGKYYLESMVSFPSGIGGREVSEVVEIKTDGETVQCKLNHIYRGFIY